MIFSLLNLNFIPKNKDLFLGTALKNCLLKTVFFLNVVKQALSFYFLPSALWWLFCVRSLDIYI